VGRAGYRFAEHGGELEVEIDSASEAGLFEGALEMFGELVATGERGEAAQFEIELTEPDPALLLVDWLNELVFLADAELFVPTGVASLELDSDGLHAEVSGERGHPRQVVKAVTLNDLELHQAGGEWRARLVLDV
jgi:SHS2 domain-containing protein